MKKDENSFIKEKTFEFCQNLITDCCKCKNTESLKEIKHLPQHLQLYNYANSYVSIIFIVTSFVHEEQGCLELWVETSALHYESSLYKLFN